MKHITNVKDLLFSLGFNEEEIAIIMNNQRVVQDIKTLYSLNS